MTERRDWTSKSVIVTFLYTSHMGVSVTLTRESFYYNGFEKILEKRFFEKNLLKKGFDMCLLKIT